MNTNEKKTVKVEKKMMIITKCNYQNRPICIGNNTNANVSVIITFMKTNNKTINMGKIKVKNK